MNQDDTNHYDRIIYGMETDDLLEAIEDWRSEANLFRDLVGKAEFELRRRMIEMDASVYASSTWEAELPTDTTYDYYMTVLERLRPLLREGEWEKAVVEVTSTKVSRNALKALAKRGGEIADIIEKATVKHETPGRPRIKRISHE